MISVLTWYIDLVKSNYGHYRDSVDSVLSKT